MHAEQAAEPQRLPRVLWAMMFGNVVIGMGVMVIAGLLNDIHTSLDVSVTTAGQLISVSAFVVCLGAPVIAASVGRWDRRQLLVGSMVWYAIFHALAALAPGFFSLLGWRVLAMLAAAAYTPQAAACIGMLVPPEQRGRAITFVFLGWSVASVLGMPIAAWMSEVHGWRMVFGMLSVLSFLSAAWVWWVLPTGLLPPVMSLSAWRQTFVSKPLMFTVLVTVISASGQFFLTAYFAPYFKQTLSTSPTELGVLFGWFGACGLLGNMLLSRRVDRMGADRAVNLSLLLIAVSMLFWSLGTSLWLAALIITPWGLGMFATNSAQQARLIHIAPALASGSVALNTSAIYLGQAIGSAGGGWLIEHNGMNQLHWLGLAGTLLALLMSLLAARATRRARRHVSV